VIGLGTIVPSNPLAAAPASTASKAATATVKAAPSGVSLSFDEAQAVAANGPIIDADELRVCGDDTGKRFLAELLGDALNYKIPYRLGDVVDGNAKPSANLGRQMMMSGTVESDVFGTGDFPFDHPAGSDFNMDVGPDPAYADISQLAGVPSGDPMHTELSEGWVPHLPSAQTGPPTGMTWEENSTLARSDVQPGYFPAKGDRVITMGRWVNDCGHPPFQTELHPLSFMAWAHTDVDKTVAQAYYAPYREMQQYNPDQSLANKVNNANRKNNFYTLSFPQGLITSILRLQNLGGLPPIDHLESWGLLEAVNQSPADWWVCAPTGTTGDTLNVNYDFRARPGVVITSTPDLASGCTRMHVDLSANTVPEPPLRTCVLPWDWLSQVAADEAGVPSLDLKTTIKSYVADQYDYRVDPDPIMDCYDPLKGQPVNPTPTGQNITVDSTISQPFYGLVEVSWSTTPPPSSTTSSSSSSSTTSASSTTTTPTGQSLTVSPATVAQGGAIEVSSGGWMPDTPVTITLDDGTVLGTLQTNRFGVAEGSFTVPTGTTLGAHQVIATGTSVTGAAEVRASITVVAAVVLSTTPPSSTGTLPTTGANIAGTVAVASFLMLAGIGVLAIKRRRPEPTV
jgi:LPXTG-motif cell wall-anchored protein